jgi:putative aldouronate transport system substrate-binding protein
MLGDGEHIWGIGFNVSYDDEGPEEGTDMIWGPYIRWDLYEELGHPEVDSLEDFLPILKEMQEMCPKSDSGKPTYGFSMWSDWDSTHMMFAKQYGAMHGYNDGDTGNLLFIHGAEPKYESFLEENGMYHRSLKLLFDANQMGLVDPDSISQKNADVNAKIQDGQVLFSYFSWVSGYNTPEHTSQGKGMYMVPFKNEKVYSYGLSTYGGIRTTCIGSKAKDPARLMDFLNWAYSDEGTMVYFNGPEGMNWIYGDSGKPELTELGIEVYNNPATVIPEEWGGGQYNDGTPKFSPGTLSSSTISKVSGEPFLNKLWTSVLDMDTNPALDSWREHFGVRTPKEYFVKNDMLSIYKVPFMPGGARVMSQDLEQKKSSIGQIVKEYSWRMVFASDEKEFNTLWDEMINKAYGLGYQELLDWTIEGAELEFAARQAGLGAN